MTEGSPPEVGIFWIDTFCRMFAVSTSLSDATDYGDCRTFDGSHLEFWDKAVRAVPQWQGLEYEDVPRGRVVYRENPRGTEIIVYMPKRIGKYRRKVIARFHLPTVQVRFDYSDEHYQLRNGKGDRR